LDRWSDSTVLGDKPIDEPDTTMRLLREMHFMGNHDHRLAI
jgi:hypothetical protein